jgi:putative membrane protein
MRFVALGLIALIAVLHLYIAWFEIFAWESRGPAVFSSFPTDLFPPTKAMAANQGLYNGFLAAGLIWALLIRDLGWQRNVALFFLVCVAVAGAFGAATVSTRILFVQTVPAVLAIVALLVGSRSYRAD